MGSRLTKGDRQALIISRLETAPALRISELAQDLGVSGETIRRDFAELAEQGLINRTYGGAARPLTTEPEAAVRSSMFTAERQRIAQFACRHVKDDMILIIGSGSTTLQTSIYLAARFKRLTVFTDSVTIADRLSTNPGIKVHLCPGVYSDAECCVCGAETVSYLSRIYADLAILGASGLTEIGPSNADLEIGMTYTQMLKSASRTLITADHSKITKQSLYTYAPWQAVDTLICDKAPNDEALLSALRFGRVNVEVAENSWGELQPF